MLKCDYTDLGGYDFDASLYQYFNKKFEFETYLEEQSEAKQQSILNEIYMTIEQLKINFSMDGIDDQDFVLNSVDDFDEIVDYSEFEEAIAEEVERFKKFINEFFQNYPSDWPLPSRCEIVGGAMHTKAIKEELLAALKKVNGSVISFGILLVGVLYSTQKSVRR